MQEENLLIRQQVNESLEDWRSEEKTALELQKLVGDLRFDNAIELMLFRKPIYNSRPSTLLHDHLFSLHYTQHNLPFK